MSVTNIILSGVGGQGLVLTTRILAEAAFLDGYDIKTSDVIGLSQRGGMVWGSVRFGEKVYSALVPEGQGDFLLALEELEGLRWSRALKQGATIILNEYKIYPNRVLIEKEEYPENIKETLVAENFKVIPLKAKDEASALGNSKIMNLVLLGKLSMYLPINYSQWIESIKNNISEKTLELNLKAFELGRTL